MSEAPKVSDPTYRDKDIKLSILIFALSVITVVVILAFIGMNALFKSHERSYLENQVLLSERVAARTLPSVSLLQVNEKKDFDAYYQQSMDHLNSAEILNPDEGIARITIDAAKEHVLTRGIMPFGQEGTPAEDGPDGQPDGQGGQAN